MSNTQSDVWLITGASSGLGKELAIAAVSHGFKVIATARDPAKLDALQGASCKALQLDVTDSADVLAQKAKEAVDIWGKIDVLVNCAGTTVLGAVEELGYEAFLTQYKTNVFGVVGTTSAFLPYMRKSQKGTVVVIGSRSAWEANSPMMGAYASSKAAVHAVSETLSAELAPFNIRVLLVEPGSMRTDNLKSAMHLSLKLRMSLIPAYAPFRAGGEKRLKELDGKQPGDPAKAAGVIIATVSGKVSGKGNDFPPLLALGEDAVQGISKKCGVILKVVENWAEVGKSIVF